MAIRKLTVEEHHAANDLENAREWLHAAIDQAEAESRHADARDLTRAVAAVATALHHLTTKEPR